MSVVSAVASTPSCPAIALSSDSPVGLDLTPVNVDRLALLLADHPDSSFAVYVVSRMRYGFSVGYNAPASCSASSVTSSNHPSALKNVEFVSSYLERCCAMGETAGPFREPPFPTMHFSGVGVVPKKNGKLRLIHNLSSPEGGSVNDGISRAEFSLEYTTIDTSVSAIMKLGAGSYLTKIDVRNAFRLCPVRPEDWHLLGIAWQDRFYRNKVLPFGLRSAPYIFNSLSESLEWIIRNTGKIHDILHYLDDFLNVSAPSLPLASLQRTIFLDLFRYLRAPVATEKVEGPSTNLEFLGIKLDTGSLSMPIPQDKLHDILSIASNALQRGTVTRRELVSVSYPTVMTCQQLLDIG